MNNELRIQSIGTPSGIPHAIDCSARSSASWREEPRGAGDDGVVDLPSRGKTEKAVKLFPRDPQMGQGGISMD